MKQLKPNHICKNANCRKLYYACDYCGKLQSWRSMACSTECYGEYMKEIDAARKNNQSVNLYPERIDMTPLEVIDMINNTSIEDLEKSTMLELQDYQSDIKSIGLGATIDKINAEL